MKKFVLAVMAVAAIGFTSCGNKTQQGEAVDSVAIIDSLAEEAAGCMISALGDQLQAGDASKLQGVLATAKDKIVELIKQNPEVAKEYVAKVQTFLKENAEKIKEIAGDNAAVTAAVSALTDLDPSSVISGFMENVEATATEAKDAAVEKAADTKDAIEQAANEQIEAGKAALKEKAEETKAAAKEKANEAVDNAAKDIKKGLGI